MDFHTFLPLFLRTVTGFERQTGFFLLWPEEVMQRKKKGITVFFGPSPQRHKVFQVEKLSQIAKRWILWLGNKFTPRGT